MNHRANLFQASRRRLDRRTNAWIGAAATQISGHELVDIGIGGVWCLFEQCHGGHNLTGLAIATLCDLVFDPDLLHKVQGFRCTQPFNGGDFTIHRRNRKRTGSYRLLIDIYRVGASHCNSATEFGTSDTQLITQCP